MVYLRYLQLPETFTLACARHLSTRLSLDWGILTVRAWVVGWLTSIRTLAKSFVEKLTVHNEYRFVEDNIRTAGYATIQFT